MQRRMGGRRWIRAMIAGLMVGSAAVMAGGASASAGEAVPSGEVRVTVRVFGGPADDVLAGLTFELYQGGGLVEDPGCDPFVAGTEPDPVFANSSSTCTPGDGEFQVGLDGVPPQYSTFATCTTGMVILNEPITDGTPTFTLGSDRYGSICTIDVRAATLAIDKVIVGGDATVADFEFEVYDSEGALIELDPIVDPDAALCEETLGDCALVGLPFGEYTLGEVAPDYGYAVTGVECTPEAFGNAEMIDLEGAAVSMVENDAYCVVTNTYQEGELVVTAEVVNDDGGTADPTDISIEVYQADGGAKVVDATACAADGSCLDMMLPIGDYVIGYVGPDGYTREITQTVSDLPASERVTDDPDAAFTAEVGRSVAIEVVIDDPEPAPTTTTTLPAVTTTSIDAGVVTLPQTGPSSSTNTALTAVAALLVVLGGAMLAVRRRA